MAEEKDMQLEPEEDVQAHQNLAGQNLEADEKGVHHREGEDEGDDVEGHAAVNLEPADAVNLRQDDDGDDVEGHVNY